MPFPSIEKEKWMKIARNSKKKTKQEASQFNLYNIFILN